MLVPGGPDRRVDAVGLGELAQGLGEVADAARVDHRQRDAGRGQRARQHAFLAARRPQHDELGRHNLQSRRQLIEAGGVRYAARSQYLYDTATANKLFMRVPVNPATLEPAGEPELVVAGRMGDDFGIDEDAQVIYLTTHRQNTIDVVSMDPGLNSGFNQSVGGYSFTYDLIGPSAGAFFLMDGGHRPAAARQRAPAGQAPAG